MYIGERLDARPIATPPSIRQKTKIPNVCAIPLPIEVAAKKGGRCDQQPLSAKTCRSNIPATSAPKRQPISAQLFAQPESAALFWM